MSDWQPQHHGMPPRVVIRFGRSTAERRLTRATLGLLIVWMGVMLAVKHHEGLGPLGAGGILIASAIAARLRGWFVGKFQWFFGAVLLAIGIAGYVKSWQHVHWFAISVIVAGVFVLYRALVGPRV